MLCGITTKRHYWRGLHVVDSEFHVAALFVQGGDDSPQLGRFQFFIFLPHPL
jgi:hypothetical protein